MKFFKSQIPADLGRNVTSRTNRRSSTCQKARRREVLKKANFEYGLKS